MGLMRTPPGPQKETRGAALWRKSYQCSVLSLSSKAQTTVEPPPFTGVVRGNKELALEKNFIHTLKKPQKLMKSLRLME